MEYLNLFIESFKNYFFYITRELGSLHAHNYIYWLIGISAFVYVLELLFPWRKDQSKVRRDFGLDTFYMFFNFFIFPLMGFIAFSTVAVALFRDLLGFFGISELITFSVDAWPVWAQLLTLFVVRDFVQFNIHRLLHRVPILWEFHKVHHSVQEMGYAAHLRYHWMENVVYRTLEFLPLAMIGYGIDDFIVVHLVALMIGHLNHANINLPYGPFRFILNNPRMHIWHHMAQNPEDKPHGVNFGISLSIWDYIFRTAHIPKSGRDIELGFENIDQFPQGFFGQNLWPFWKSSDEKEPAR